MQVKLLQDLVEELAGVGTNRIVDILYSKRDVNEFFIAKKMDLTINQVRNILYKLSADGLVTFIRKKDKRKGWYIYYWTLKIEKCLVKLEQSLINKIENLKSILNSRETKRFYVCKSCSIEVGEEKALENGFSCEECAEIYELSDNSNQIRDTKDKIVKVEKDLKLIKDELEVIRSDDAKKRARSDKKEAKEVESKKALIKAAKIAARKSLVKKVVKPNKKVFKKDVKKKMNVKKKFIKKKTSKNFKKIIKGIKKITKKR